MLHGVQGEIVKGLHLVKREMLQRTTTEFKKTSANAKLYDSLQRRLLWAKNQPALLTF
jgi:hypothetical protein